MAEYVPENVFDAAGVAVIPVPPPANADEATAMIASAATATARMIFFKRNSRFLQAIRVIAYPLQGAVHLSPSDGHDWVNRRHVTARARLTKTPAGRDLVSLN